MEKYTLWLYFGKSEIHGEKEYTVPRNYIEKQLAEVWQDVLKVDKIGINGNIYSFKRNS